MRLSAGPCPSAAAETSDLPMATIVARWLSEHSYTRYSIYE